MTPRRQIALAKLAGGALACVLLVVWVAFLQSPPFGGGIQLGPLVENLAEAFYELPSNPAILLQLLPLLMLVALVVYPPLAIGLYVYSRILTLARRIHA